MKSYLGVNCNCKDYLHTAQYSTVDHRYLVFDAKGTAIGEPLTNALLVIAKPYKDIVWC